MSTENEINREYMIDFFETIVQKLKNKTLMPEDEKRLGEFYMQCMCNRQYETSSNDEQLKYFTLGWYVYEILLKS
jgi:hypothetical protein